MKIFAETERFILREMLPTDVEGMFELDADPDVHRYLGNEPANTKEEIVDIINFIRQQYVDQGIGRWAIIDKESNEFIGWSGLKFVTNEINNHRNYYDLGYRLIKRKWGQGIATETSIASIEYAFVKLKAQEVYAIADCQHEASNKILKKVGLLCVDTFDLDGVQHNWYKMDRTTFMNKIQIR